VTDPFGRTLQLGSAMFYANPAEELRSMFDFEGALEELMRCSIRRKNR